jgi:DNA-binding winged helix-turn-helix (wHTH) protein
MPGREPSIDWAAVLDRVQSTLARVDLNERPRIILTSLREDFGWSLVEYWRAESGVYRLADVVHTAGPEFEQFAAGSREITIPVGTSNFQRLKDIQGVTPLFGGIAFWLTGLRETPGMLRRELASRAGFQTRVFIPITNDGFVQQQIFLWDVERREASPDEIQALGIATFLLGRSLLWDGEQPPLQPKREVNETHLDPETRSLIGPRATVRLTVAEWDLLSLLFSVGRKALSFAELTQRVWRAPEEYVGRAPLYELVGRARRHLASVGGDCAITSVPRYGYMLERSRLDVTSNPAAFV